MRGVGVQARSRLVHEQHTRVRDERNAYVCALCLQQQEPTGNLLKVGIRLLITSCTKTQACKQCKHVWRKPFVTHLNNAITRM